eukprot:GHVP01033751.1.p1 GENE.GHVP01033751.1~~GHVP01033751.1.p1  ORF type:complete len:747 (-),score=128.50 GHVP01033751.1:329-2569(-)
MTKILNVAEKPSVAREISKHLGRGNARRLPTSVPSNPISAFPYTFGSDNVEMIVTSVRGHLMELTFANVSKDWNVSEPLFTEPVKKNVSEPLKDIAKDIGMHAKSCKMLVLWLDCDREGENIAFEVLQVALAANPRLMVKRAIFSALTYADITRAMNNLGIPNKQLSDAVECRQEIDLRIGAAFTRFLTSRFKNKFDIPAKFLSYGPCQIPTLGFVVERWKIIRDFVPENFWYLVATIKKGNQEVNLKWKRHRVYDRMVGLILLELCLSAPEVLVTSVTGRPTTKRKPIPLDTVEMTKAATRKLRISSQKCMQTAEALYNKGLVSYPRTETNIFPKTMDLLSIVKVQEMNSRWGEYAAQLSLGKFDQPRGGSKDDKAHPPIHPVKHSENFDNDEEKNLYEFITRHFLAACSEDAKGFQTVAEFDINGEEFSTSGLTILSRNYLDVYSYESWSGNNIPEFLVFEKLPLQKLDLVEGKTEPPPLLAEADLIDKMDKSGIGTDATMHEHIQTIQTRCYAEKVDPGNKFKPTELGVALSDGLEAFASLGINLLKPELRAMMESDMKKIAEGQASKDEIIRKHSTDMLRIFKIIRENSQLIDTEFNKNFRSMAASMTAQDTKILLRGAGTCPNCQSPVDIKCPGAQGRSRGNVKKPAASDGNPRFYICRNQENCSALRLPLRGLIDQHPSQMQCPICNHSVLRITNEKTKKSHFVCPGCFNTPPPGFSGTEMRCFMCPMSNCPVKSGRTLM